MKRMIRLLVFVLYLAGLTILLQPTIIQAQNSEKLTKDTFEEQLTKALEVKDEAKMVSLVKENRYWVEPLVTELLDSYIKAELDGKIEEAKENLSKAEELAIVYQEVFDEDNLSNRTKLFRSWSVDQKQRKLLADSIQAEAAELYSQSKFKAALYKWEESLKIYREICAEKEEGTILGNIGITYDELGNYPEALDYYQQALMIGRKAGDREQEGTVLGHVGLIYHRLGDYERALEYYGQAMAIDREIGYKRGEGMQLGNMGAAYYVLGDYRKALDHFQQSLAIDVEIYNREGEGADLSNIGAIYYILGDYVNSLDYYRRALAIDREIGGRRGEAIRLENLGLVYQNLGNLSKALDYHQRALKIFSEIGSKQEKGMALSSIGDVYEDLGDYRKALDHFQQALKINKDLGDIREEGFCLGKFGDIYGKSGDYLKALTYHQQALKIAKEIGEKMDEASHSASIGETYLFLRNDTLALKNYREALEIALEIGNPVTIWWAQHGLGTVLEKQGKHDEALNYYTQAIETIESLREKLRAESFKIGFMEDKISVYESVIELLVKMGRVGEAFAYAERAKARSLLDILSLGQIDITEGISPELLAKNKNMERRLNKIYEGLSEEYSRGEPDTLIIANLEDNLKNTRAEHQEILEETKLNHPKYAKLTGISKPLTLDELQKKVLRKGAVLIEYFVGEDNTNVWVVGKDWCEHEKIELTRGELEEMVTELRRPFVDVKEGKIRNFADIGFDLRLSQRLYSRIFQPMEKFITQADNLIIVPDGILHYLPFEALVTEIAERPYDRNLVFSKYENAKYLIEKYPISYIPSASVLDPELIAKGKAGKEGGLLAFGDPDFGRARGEKEEAEDFDYLTFLTRSSKGWIFRPLPKSEEEVKAVSDIMKPSLIYTKDMAKEDVFKEKAHEFSIIHLATHAVLEETQPMYSRIVFAQDDDPQEDGFLQTFEVFNLELDADLVTLSACETGLGKLSRGEGLVGLTRAFMYAATRSILVSLWSVEESTSKMMRYFYQNLRDGMSKTEALRQAKIKLIGTKNDGISFAHPFLWAPFVLVGDYR